MNHENTKKRKYENFINFRVFTVSRFRDIFSELYTKERVSVQERVVVLY